jgi:replicative DNA helicase
MLAAERALIGGALADPAGADRACEVLVAQDFLDEGCRRSFLAIQRLTLARSIVTHASVAAAMRGQGPGAEALHDMTSEAGGHSGNVGSNAKLILAGAQLRRLTALGAWLAKTASEAAVTVDAPELVLEELRIQLDEVTARTPGRLPIRLAEAEPGLLERILSDEPTPQGVKTGFEDLDAGMGGLRDGEVVVLAARPSVGKSLAAANIAENVSFREAPRAVLFLTMEMSGASLYRRFMFSRAGVDADAALSGSASSDEKARLTEAHTTLWQAPWYVHYESGLTAQRAHALARRFKNKHGPCLLVVDYLQLMRGPGAGRTEMVTNLSAAMKGLAVDLNIPVLLLSQLNRGGAEERERDGSTRVKIPTLADLRDSGAIEQDADVVIFLARDILQQNPHPCDLVVAKNRPGRTGRTQLLFDTAGPRFRDIQRVEHFDGRN